MDEETAIIDQNTRNEKIKNFFIKNKNKIISIVVVLIVILCIFFGYGEYSDREKNKLSDKYNSLTIQYNTQNKEVVKKGLIEIIKEKDATYSPLALYFIIDNQLSEQLDEINNYFDILIDDTSLEKEIKNLIIYKKALYNADQADEIQLLEILKPILNSESVWKSHALYLVAEFFYFKDQKQKAKEFFDQIIVLENSNQDIKTQTQQRLNRDFSE